MSEKHTLQVRGQITLLTFSRLFINIGIRMVYPFLPAFSRGLGVPLTAVAGVVSLRSFVSIASPLFGPTSERFGRRKVMAAAMLFFALGNGIVILWPQLWAFGLTLSVIAIAKVIYDPAMQAYIGDTIPYQKRGRLLAITELSWATAFLLGVPLVGFLIQEQGWQSPFLFLGMSGLIAVPLIWRLLPKADNRASIVVNLKGIWPFIRSRPVIWAAAVYILFVMGANELLLIVYGGWMEESFSLSLTSLGLATSVIGGAELIGEIFTALFVDRIGKRPFVIVAGLGTAAMYVLMPRLGVTLIAALITLFLLFLFFEMSVVGGVPLMTELVPSARGVVMSVVFAAAGLGRALGALLGPRIKAIGGFDLLGLVAGLTMAIGVIILTIWIREASSDPSD